MDFELTPRWTQLRAHAVQSAYWNSKHLYNLIPAGRRSGKTELFKRKLIYRALRGTKFPNARFFAAAPTFQQAKRIYWQDLKRLVPKEFLRGKPSETELVIPLINGSDIYVIGMDKPERIEGQPWDGGGLDEYANTKAEAWGANIQPALADRNGWCDFLGVPEGRNHYYDLSKIAQADKTGLWGFFHWISSDILPPEIIQRAKDTLDELTYLQEYEASFINFMGRAYYEFEFSRHCKELRYDASKDLIITFDFNVSPGTAAVMQEQMLPNMQMGTGVIGEVHIPRNSNTPLVCSKLIKDWGEHKGRVFVYGDATGGASGSAKVEGSDWDLIRRAFRNEFDGGVYYEVPKSNPRERTRVNAVNSRLMSETGIIKFMVDPDKAPNIVRDFEGVSLVEGGAGEIDKKADKKLTHLTDGIGYYVEREYPIAGAESNVIQVIGA